MLYDFNGREDDELTVYAGESVSVLELVSNEWARCYDPGRDRTGIIPVSFLNIFMNEDDEESSHEGTLRSVQLLRVLLSLLDLISNLITLFLFLIFCILAAVFLSCILLLIVSLNKKLLLFEKIKENIAWAS